MDGMVALVKASMSRARPGTAAERILLGPRYVRRVERRRGYAWISQALAEFGISL